MLSRVVESFLLQLNIKYGLKLEMRQIFFLFV
jgi:hypothetical protein